MTKDGMQMMNDELGILSAAGQTPPAKGPIPDGLSPRLWRLGLRHSPHHSSFVVLAFVILLGGCAVGPNYKRPAIESPANYRFAASFTTNSLADLPWWQVFKDPILQDPAYMIPIFSAISEIMPRS